MMSHHFSKPVQKPEDARDPLSAYNFRGSSKWFDAPDTLVTAVRLPAKENEWWRIKTDWTTRQGESPGRLDFVVGDGGRINVVENEALKPITVP